MNKFLNFANLFDFWSIIPEAKPRSIPEAIKSASKRIVEIMDDQEGLDAKFVRLSFHDCVGGCDGCVDLNNPENFGLEQPIDALDSVVRRNAEFLTTADVWALAGLVASQERQNDNSQADFGLQLVQRPDCVGGGTKAGPSRTMPSAHLTTRGLLEFFNATFGFNSRETVAIMGGHTL